MADVCFVQDELCSDWEVQRSKNQNKCWLKEKAKRLQVAKPKLTTKKTLFLIAFTSCPSRFSITALPKDEKIDAECYIQFLKDTGKRFNNLRRSKTKFRDLTLQFDNARPRIAERTRSYMSAVGLTNIKQSPYSPELNLCDRFLFTRLQEHCRMQHYENSEELKVGVQRFLRQLPKSLFLS